jgi:hypothetical protein
MSTATETETKKAIDDTGIRRALPVIDFKNDWLNKDRELYTLIFTKASVGIALSMLNVALGSDRLDTASRRSLLTVFMALQEMGHVSLNRLAIMLLDHERKSYPGLILVDLLVYGVIFPVNVMLSMTIAELDIFEGALPPIPQIQNNVINPLFNAVVGAPRIQQPNVNLQQVQRALNTLRTINYAGGTFGIFLGMAYTQIIQLGFDV